MVMASGLDDLITITKLPWESWEFPDELSKGPAVMSSVDSQGAGVMLTDLG